MAKKEITLEVGSQPVKVTNPDKIYFPEAGHTKLDLVRYYIAVAEPALRAVGDRPMALKRYPNGIAGEFFYQKRAPQQRPDYIHVATFAFPSGRTAEEVVVGDAAGLAWVVNLGCIDLHPHPVRAKDLDHPDELRVDLDPVPGTPFEQVREVALLVKDTLSDFGLVGWPKTSGSRGMHVWVRIKTRWPYTQVRRAAVALAREVERRAPDKATSKWWKEERHGVFLDYNQNARDRTTAAAWSVRPTSDARVSMPLSWSEVPQCDPSAFTLRTVPLIVASRGDPHEMIDASPGNLDGLLDLAKRHEADGIPDAPWPPHFAKQEKEEPRVQPSKRRSPGADRDSTGPEASTKARGRRVPKVPLLTVARSGSRDEALAGFERWRTRHPEVAPHLQAADVLVDAMRGRSTTWTRVRVNLVHVPVALRPEEEPPDPDEAPVLGERFLDADL